MSEPKETVLTPASFEVGISSQHNGIVTVIQVSPTETLLIVLPPEAAFVYGAKLQEYAQKCLSSVSVQKNQPETSSVKVERERPDRLDS